MSANATTINVDRGWFRKNPNRNFRIRRGAPGEAEEIMRRSMRGVGYELELANGAIPDIGDDREFRICVVNAGAGTLLRMPVVRLKDSPDEIGADGRGASGVVLIFGKNIIMDRRAG